MRTPRALSIVSTLVALAMPLAASVHVQSPLNGSQVDTPVQYTAAGVTASCAKGVGGIGVYVDNRLLYVQQGADLNASLAVAAGKHQTVVEEWDRCGGASYTMLNIVVSTPTLAAATPQFSVPSGTYPSAQMVSLSASTPGEAIYFTTDGTAPTSSSMLYTSSIRVAVTETLMAIGVAPGFSNSGMARSNYVIKPSSSGPSIPTWAIKESQIQLAPGWKMNHDAGTPGTASGGKTIVSRPSLSGKAAEFASSYAKWGGEIYHVTFANDDASTHFVYDAQIWIEAGSQIGNLELDMNQVIANGDTVIYGFQCDGDHGTWDYSANSGPINSSGIGWRHASAPCNPAKWATNTWHHVQISYSRDESGNVTYEGVWLDGVESHIGVTVPSADPLHWAGGVLLTNFQVDGLAGVGASILYLDELTVYRW